MESNLKGNHTHMHVQKKESCNSLGKVDGCVGALDVVQGCHLLLALMLQISSRCKYNSKLVREEYLMSCRAATFFWSSCCKSVRKESEVSCDIN